jgi:hypothetical protein
MAFRVIPLCLVLLAVGVVLSRNYLHRRDATNPESNSPRAPTPPGGGRIAGRLLFGSRGETPFQGTVVGEPGDANRRYITGSPDSPQRAIWQFDELPPSLMSPEGDAVSARFTCSLYRLANAPDLAVVTIRIVSHNCPQTPPGEGEGEWRWADREAQLDYRRALNEYQAKGIDLHDAQPGAAGWRAVNELAERFGYYQTRLPGVIDRVETSVNLPAGLFRNALKQEAESNRAPVSVYVKCETIGFLLGVAEPDLYLEDPAVKR